MATENHSPDPDDQCCSRPGTAEDSSLPSTEGKGNASAEGKKPAWGRPSNGAIETGPAVMGGLVSWPALSDSIRTSPKYSSSDGILQKSLNHSCNGSTSNADVTCSSGIPGNGEPSLPSAEVSLCSPDEQKSSSKEISKGDYSHGDNRSRGGYGYRHDQDRRHEWKPNSYRGLSGRGPHMQFPREQPRAYMRPLVRPPMHPMPFISHPLPVRSFQGSIGFPNVPFHVYHYPTYPQPESFRGPSFRGPSFRGPTFVPHPTIHAAQQSQISAFPDNLGTKLLKQIEYYFSSENLCKDYYLKRHMNEQGWVPITLIAGFKKVKELTNNVQFILDSLRSSDVVEVKDDRIRKRHEWEKWVLPQALIHYGDESGNQSQASQN